MGNWTVKGSVTHDFIHCNVVAVHGQGLFFSSGRDAFSDFTSWKLH